MTVPALLTAVFRYGTDAWLTAPRIHATGCPVRCQWSVWAALPAYGHLGSEPAHFAVLKSNNLQAPRVGTSSALLTTGRAHESDDLEAQNERNESNPISRVVPS